MTLRQNFISKFPDEFGKDLSLIKIQFTIFSPNKNRIKEIWSVKKEIMILIIVLLEKDGFGIFIATYFIFSAERRNIHFGL